MIRIPAILILSLLTAVITGAQPEGNVLFRGQLSGWINANPANDLPLWTGIRYIPRVNYGIPFGGNRLIDIELSPSISGTSGMHPFDQYENGGDIKPYRVWARYSSARFEVRAGLQKINFGSASLVRPLMWFDQVDPRDPLQLTDGVWALLGRYYFLNNVNIWVWGLYGNEGPKTWEISETAHRKPEFGGRFQVPVPRGETAISFHHRQARFNSVDFSQTSYWSSLPGDNSGAAMRTAGNDIFLKNLAGSIFAAELYNRRFAGNYLSEFLDENDEIVMQTAGNGVSPESHTSFVRAQEFCNHELAGADLSAIPENRLGIDGKWDIGIGLWAEAAWFRKGRSVGMLTNQHIMTVGADYTFSIGNGIHTLIEQVLISTDRQAFRFGNRNHFTAASLSYPLGIFDNISAIIYRDWTNENIYSFVNWHRQFNRLGFYLMGFWNPETFHLPQQTEGAQMFSGRGVQFMLVFNH